MDLTDGAQKGRRGCCHLRVSRIFVRYSVWLRNPEFVTYSLCSDIYSLPGKVGTPCKSFAIGSCIDRSDTKNLSILPSLEREKQRSPTSHGQSKTFSMMFLSEVAPVPGA